MDELSRAELQDALTNFGFMTLYAEPDAEFSLSHTATFLHYYNHERLFKVMEWLRNNGYIDYTISKKRIQKLIVYKNEL